MSISYQFAPEGTRLLWLDGFGLGRLSRAGRIKTDRRLQAGQSPLLSQDREGRRMLAYSDKRTLAQLLDPETLTLLGQYASLQWHSAALSPGGDAIIALTNDDEGYRLSRHPLDPHTPDALGAATHDVKLATETPTPQAFSPDHHASNIIGIYEPTCRSAQLAFAVHHDGTFSLFDAAQGQLHYGTLPGEEAPFLRSHRLFAGYYAPRFFPARDGLLVCAYDSDMGRAFYHWYPSDTEQPRATGAFEASGVPQRRGHQIAYRHSLCEIKVIEITPEEESTRSPTTRCDLTPLLEHAISLGFDDESLPGELIASPNRMLFLPWHGEALLDLDKGHLYTRHLNKTEAPLRRSLMSAFQQIEAAGHAANLHLTLGCFDYAPKAKELALWLHTTPGDGTLIAALVQASVREVLLCDVPTAHDQTLQLRDQMGPEVDEQPLPFTIDEDDLRTLFEHAANHQLGLRPLYQHFLKAHYIRCLLGREGQQIFEPCAPTTEDAEQILIWSMVEALGQDRPSHHLDLLEVWKQQEAAPIALYQVLRPIDGATSPALLQTIDALGLVLGHYFSELPLGRVGDALILHDYIPSLDPTLLEQYAEEATTETSLLAHVRTALLRAPTSLHFSRLMDLFEDPEHPEIDLAIAYASQHLQGWPYDLRCNPKWLDWHEPHPGWQLIQMLDLREEYFRSPEKEFAALRGLPCFDQLVGLQLDGSQFPMQQIPLLCSFLQEIPQLRDLTLDQVRWSEASAKHFARSPHVARLEHLRLAPNLLETTSLRHILHELNPEKLLTLDLSRGYWVNDASACGPLLGQLCFPSLTSLHLDFQALEDEHVIALARNPHMTALQSLSLEGNQIGLEGILALLRSPHLQHLQRLNIAKNNTGDVGIIGLADTPEANRLTHLNITSNQLHDVSLEAIAASPYLTQLQQLSLQYNNATDRGLVPFVCAEQLQLSVRLPGLSTMTQSGLIRVARHFGITGYSGYRRNQLEAYIHSELTRH